MIIGGYWRLPKMRVPKIMVTVLDGRTLGAWIEPWIHGLESGDVASLASC